MVKAIQDISWQAEEYIVRKRNAWWYVGLFTIAVGLGTLSVFLGQWTFLALIIVCVLAIIVSSVRPPRKIQYTLDKNGLTEGKVLHKYEDYRAFGIMREGTHFSAILIPKKRLALQVKVYFPEKNGEAIVDALGARLPMENVKLDLLDKLVNFLRI